MSMAQYGDLRTSRGTLLFCSSIFRMEYIRVDLVIQFAQACLELLRCLSSTYMNIHDIYRDMMIGSRNRTMKKARNCSGIGVVSG